MTEEGPTALEAARTPNLDALAARGMCGLHVPIGPGITPGSGPAHLALFGYDPVAYQIGRGVLEALGVDFELLPQDLAARGNFCTVDADGNITDRRAGRIPTEVGAEACALLHQIELPGVELFVQPVKEYRFLLVLRGEGLVEGLTETDPQQVGVPPLPVEAERPEAEATAALVNRFVGQARQKLAGNEPANMILLRGFAKRPDWPLFPEVFGLRAGALAVYPMYRGVAKLVGMEGIPTGPEIPDEFDALAAHWDEYDFFFVHIKKTDSAGEDGNFERKVAIIEEVDAHIPRLMALHPDVVVVTGDHSTPALLRSHSWHPVPVLLYSPHCRADSVQSFSERACVTGGLGQIPATDLMPLAMANALRLTKFGA